MRKVQNVFFLFFFLGGVVGMRGGGGGGRVEMHNYLWFIKESALFFWTVPH